MILPVETVETFAVELHISAFVARLFPTRLLTDRVLTDSVLARTVLTVRVLTRSVENVAPFAARLEMFTMLLLAVTPDSVEMKMVSLTVTT